MSDFLQNMLDGLPDSYQKSIGFPVYDILHAFSIGLQTLDDKLSIEREKLDVENLQGAELTRFCDQFRAIRRREATFADGFVTVFGNGTVQAGDLFESTGGVQFEATESVKIIESGDVPVRAKVAGNVGNVPSESVKGIPITISGINAVTNENAISGGYDAETDDELRYRYYLNVQQPPTSGNAAHYKIWALEVAGVGAVKVYPLRYGNHTVGVTIINNRHEPAEQELVDAVQNYIDPGSTGNGDGQAPIGARCTVISASAAPIQIAASITLSSTGDILDVQADFEDAVQTYLQSLPFDDKQPAIVSYARIGALLLDISGVLDYTGLLLNEATANIEIDADAVAILGEVALDVAN